MATQEEVRLIFEAVDRYSAVTDDLAKQIDAISKRAESAQVEARNLANTVRRDLAEDGARDVGGLGMSFGNLTTSIGATVAMVGTFATALDRAFDYGERGAQLVNLEQSYLRFTETANQSGEAVLAAMQRMSAGMLTQTELMQQYNRAYLLIGEEVAAKMPELIGIATAASAAGMGDMQHMLNSLTVGIGRLSPMILDNLGFTISLSDAYATYAASVGKATDELTKAEQQQAVLNQVMAQAKEKFGDTGGAAEMAGAGIAQVRTQVQDLKDAVAELAAGPIDDVAAKLSGDLVLQGLAISNLPGPLGAVGEAVSGNARAITQMEQVLAGYNKRLEEGASWWDKLTGQAPNFAMMEGEILGLAQGLDVVSLSAEQFALVLEILDAVAPGTADEFRAMRAEAIQLREAIDIARQMDAADAAMRAMGGGARVAQVDLNSLGGAVQNLTGYLSNMIGMASGAGDALAGMGTDLRISMMKAQDYARGITKPQLDWYTTGKMPWELPDAYRQYTRDLGNWIEGQGRQLWRDHESDIRSAGGAYNDLQKDMEAYYQSWQSQAEGVLQPTQSTDFSQLEAELGLRQEAFDENARRARAVAERGPEAERQWAEMLGLGSREEALQYMKDFYAGNLPEDQYNWQAAIDQYRTQMEGMIGQQNLQAMFQEKLVGAGLGPDSSLVMQALEGPFSDAGTQSGDVFVSAFQGLDWNGLGEGTGDKIMTGLRNKLEKGDPKLTSAVETVVHRVIKSYIGAGGELP